MERAEAEDTPTGLLENGEDPTSFYLAPDDFLKDFPVRDRGRKPQPAAPAGSFAPALCV